MNRQTKQSLRHYAFIAGAMALTLYLFWLSSYETLQQIEATTPAIAMVQKAKADDVLDPTICGLQDVVCPDESDDNEAKADEMLAGTPMQGLGSLIVETANEYGVSWSLIIGIAEAESGRGNHYVYQYDKENCHNAWGIKPPKGRRDDGSYLRCYNDWQSGIRTIAAILSRRYKDQTPEQMCGVYVVPCNQSWIKNVRKFYHDAV